ncbi:hypothetical protein IEO21_01862 [Rhodonia placenta]|uniref:SAC domain-containing protein n=1 Tax=Rhodonia placenta TaxID=104341 RepID=A0A8H7P925_9APHY|nr:hypothetical protein IEO21_01862 [Postia placenta]
MCPVGNYDISEMHYNGPTGNAGYGYNIRVEGHRCSDLPAMKRLLSFKSIPAVKSVPAAPANPTGTVPHTTSLQPKYVLPPLPHPCPHEHIALLATAQGLLLRPHFLSETRPESYVRILWGKTGAIEELPINEDADQDWSESVIIYGIVGILELFSASYLLVVSARSEVGHLFDPRHAVYSVKRVAAIPLVEDRAHAALNLLARSNTETRVSLIPPSRSETPPLAEEVPPASALFSAGSSFSAEAASPHVKFAAEPHVKVMTPQSSRQFPDSDEGSPPSPTLSAASSAASTPSSEYSLNTDTVVKTLTARLSFWSHRVPAYGDCSKRSRNFQTIVNLAEQHGKESQVTNAYRDFVSELDDENIRYLAYDFHTETKGMKYENISKLISQLERTFENQGYFWISNNTMMSHQKGVFRVNCIDCLDRTNVVEVSLSMPNLAKSAFARHVLNRQLGAVALLDPSEEKQRTETDVVFNDVWANNGDAISREYAGTSALKGDFTRTGKRDLTGMLNDGVNSLARMYSSTFADWFSQAVIDYILGNRTLSVFSEFLNKLQSTDPRDLIRISKIRADAIATCVSRVLPEGERLLSGWTLFSPAELNAKVGDKFEEKVLLLVRILVVNCVLFSSSWYSLDCECNLHYSQCKCRTVNGSVH